MIRKSFLSVAAFGIAALLLASPANAQTTTTGAITGTVVDETTGAPMLLVTVVASSPALQGTQSEFTDAAGQFYISSLPPGTYSLLFIYGDAKVKYDNVQVFIGKTITRNAKINPAGTGEVITIKEKAPTIDTGNTKQGTTITPDYTKNVPNRGRTYEGVLNAAPGAQSDTYGVSFSGSTSVENSYVVDGVNTTSLTFGTVGSPLLNNFIQEIEVITGGYNAEFGRSTGGVVNVVTKTGSNEFHGSVWATVTPFEAPRERIFTAGSALTRQDALGTDLDFGFDLGGPIVKDKVWFYVGFAPVIAQNTVTRITGTQVDRERNNWNYGAIPDPDGDPMTVRDVGCETHPGGLSCESDGIADLDPATGLPKFEEIDRKEFTESFTTFQVTSKINFAVNPDNQGQVGFIGNFIGGTDVLHVRGTPTATQEDLSVATTDLSAKWTSKFLNNKLQLDVVAGWHRDSIDGESVNSQLPGSPGTLTRETPRQRYFNFAQGFINLGALGRNRDVRESQMVLDYCTDDFNDPSIADPFPTIENCPQADYSMNSIGFVDDTVEQRYTGKLTATYRLKAAGHHQIKVGADVEDNFLDDNRILTGGKLYESFDDWEVVQFVRIPNDITNWTRPDGSMYDVCRQDFDGDGYGDTAVPCDYLDGTSEADPENDPILAVRGETFNWSSFVQDSWSILPNLTVNLGFRYEQQRLKYGENMRDVVDPITNEALGADAMNLTDLYAPRFGIIYDWTKEGRSKVYAHWGRFYESIPMDLNNRSFGGETQYEPWWDWYSQCGGAGGTPGPDDPLIPALPEGCPAGPSQDNTTDVPYADILIGGGSLAPGTGYGIPPGVTLIVPGIKPQYLDEFVMGVEYELMEDLRAGLSAQYRRIGEVIEDVSTDGAATYFLANPGTFPEEEEAKMEDQIGDLMAQGRTMEAEWLTNRLNAFKQVRLFDKPRRDYLAVQLTAVKRFSRAFMLQGSYTYSSLEGNYPGLFSPDTGQLDPNITSQYDLIELLANRDGQLPHDRPHSFKLDGYYTFDLKEAGRVTAGAKLRAQSGVPVDVLGRHNVYGRRESYLLPRGAGGRTDFVATGDLHVAYGRKIGSMELEVFFELFNVFNTQTETLVDEEYTVDRVNPIVGGDFEDLPYLKRQAVAGGAIVESGLLARKRINYENTVQRLAPLTGRFGLQLTF